VRGSGATPGRRGVRRPWRTAAAAPRSRVPVSGRSDTQGIARPASPDGRGRRIAGDRAAGLRLGRCGKMARRPAPRRRGRPSPSAAVCRSTGTRKEQGA
jgi:hypothetical protein